VTHHVEEIEPFFTHVLLLRDGKTFAAGAREDVLTSAHLTATFGAPVFVRRSGSGYRLEVGRHAKTFMR
jgi:iron complex transport system ATP-binding protein